MILFEAGLSMEHYVVVRLRGLLIQLEFDFDVTTDIVVVRVWLEQLVAINCFAIQISNHSCSQHSL